MIRSTIVGVLMLASTEATIAQVSATSAPRVPEIVNVGVGEVRLRPDRVLITIAVTTHAATAASAGRANVDRIRPVLAALRRQSLPDSAITTSGYSVGVEYQPETPGVRSPPRRYVARNAVRVRFTRLDDLGKLLDTALAAGATEIADVTFESSLAEGARQRAIGIAVRAARTDAASAAEAAGGTLGAIIEVEIDPDQSAVTGRRTYARLSEVVVINTPMMPDDISVVVQARVRSVLLRQAP